MNMKQLPKKLTQVSRMTYDDMILGDGAQVMFDKINQMIDFLTPEEDRCIHGVDGTDCFKCYPATCGKLMSVGAVTGDTYCRNPKPCHLHSKKHTSLYEDLATSICNDCNLDSHCFGAYVNCDCSCTKKNGGQKEPIEFKEQSTFDSNIIEYDAITKILKIDISKLPGKQSLPKDWGTINLQENNNAIYAKGQENGKKQGRKEMKEKVTKILAKWVHKGEYSLDDLLEDLRNL